MRAKQVIITIIRLATILPPGPLICSPAAVPHPSPVRRRAMSVGSSHPQADKSLQGCEDSDSHVNGKMEQHS